MANALKKSLADQLWHKGFSALEEFRQREGHCRVPRHHIEGTYRLGQWVAVQRYTQDAIAPERRKQLNNIGFVWSDLGLVWEQKFAALKAFKARAGHCYVPSDHIEGELKLGLWVSVQRRNKFKMSGNRRRRLDEIGFVWSPPTGHRPRVFAPHDLVARNYPNWGQ